MKKIKRETIERTIELRDGKIKVTSSVVEVGSPGEFDELLKAKKAHLAHLQHSEAQIKNLLDSIKRDKPKDSDEAIAKAREITEWVASQQSSEEYLENLRKTQMDLAQVEEDLLDLEKLKKELDDKES